VVEIKRAQSLAQPRARGRANVQVGPNYAATVKAALSLRLKSHGIAGMTARPS
jgi:hypothetical protein